MTYYNDERGNLGVIDDREIPFKIKRVFWITNVPANATRGNHAHRDCEQVIVCLLGSFVAIIDGQSYRMTNYNGFILAIAGSYIQLNNFSPDAVCLVLCSEYYNASDVYQSTDGVGRQNRTSLPEGH